ncbi:MAG TPA: cyclopropane-fatty-acyl-phospholipid synthase family protein [Caulobacterales bacterium]|nr:cyclopropane-fatty-acyl-phospholipid synthase family protein [Caulobacterales bacterium]
MAVANMLEAFIRSFFQVGALIVRLPNGRSVAVGGVSEDDAPIIVRVRDRATEWRILTNVGLAIGEAYMDGGLTIERGDIYDFLEIGVRNLQGRKKPRGLRAAVQRWIATANSRASARRNVARHYDLSGELYRLFLDEDRQYSCAYFADPDMELEEAQRAKKRHLMAKLLLRPSQKVLDIGCGWGGLALTLAEEHGAEVCGVTLSEEQFAAARRRALMAGLDKRVHFELRDYRDIVGRYDRIVSVGMFEHVGRPNYQSYFDTVARLLTDDGVALIHTIGRVDGPTPTSPWIAKYIFPGGYIPALSEIMPAIERAGLVVCDIEVLRLHYARTLRFWRERFAEHRDEVRALYDERFCRMWEFYLAGSEASFRAGGNVVFQLQLAKRNDVVPITRDYVGNFERAHAARPGLRIAAE